MYDPVTKLVTMGYQHIANPYLRIVGIPVKLDADMAPGRIDFYKDPQRFCCAPGEYPIENFITLLNETKKVVRMSDQLLGFDEAEHDRTGGPTWQMAEEALAHRTAAWDPPSVGVPLQEQVETVEAALSKALEVIEAFLEREKELVNDVYQAQLDATDWMSKYNALNVRDQLSRRSCDEEQIRELTTEVQAQASRIDRLGKRNEELVWQNEQLEVKLEERTEDYKRLLERNVRQAARLSRIQEALQTD